MRKEEYYLENIVRQLHYFQQSEYYKERTVISANNVLRTLYADTYPLKRNNCTYE